MEMFNVPMGGDDEDGPRGFAINMEHINPDLNMQSIVELIEAMKNIMEQIEKFATHGLLMDHDGQEEADGYFEAFIEMEDEGSLEDKARFWSANKLNAIFAVKEAASYICDRFLEVAGADGSDLDHGIPD